MTIRHTSSPGRIRLTILLSVMLPMFWAAPPAHAQDAPIRRGLMQTRARALMERLARGDEITVVAFGDSLTAGWATEGRDAFPRIVADVLQYRFPKSTVKLITRGHPGETTAGALRKLLGNVVAREPDLVLVQFGGNDMGWGRSVRDFRRDLARLLARVADETTAPVIACLPPISHADPNNEWSDTARKVARGVGIPAADLDRAIRAGDPDFRGPFPYESHPDGFTHVVMAREVLRALDETTRTRPALACRFVEGSAPATGANHTVEARVTSRVGDPLNVEARLEWLAEGLDRQFALAAEKTHTIRHEIALPLQPFPGHSYRIPVRVMARGGGHADFDLCWLTVAPAITADRAPDGKVDLGALTWHPISGDALTLGRHTWLGPTDLIARFAVVVLPDTLRFLVQVADDSIAVASLADPSQGDSVELYLDLRGDADQGKPVYSSSVLALQAIAPVRAGAAARWRSMQALPGDLNSIKVACAAIDGGYSVTVDIPLAPIVARRGENWQGFGFDVGVNDADFGGTRDCQLMWTGFPDNYLNPAYLGGLYLDETPAGATRRTLR